MAVTYAFTNKRLQMTDTTPLKEAHDEAEDLLALIDIGLARANQLAEQSRRILDITNVRIAQLQAMNARRAGEMQ